MKIKYILGLLVPCLVQGAVEADLNKGVDLTGRTSVTPSILNQLVDNGTIKTNKGLIIASATAPDVDLNRRYTNFLWLDISVSPPSLKSWITVGIGSNPNSSTNWASATIGSLSITTDKIANLAVTSDKLGAASVNNSKIATNSISVAQLQVDSVSTSNIQDSAVVNAKIGALAVTADKIQNDAIITTKILDNNITSNKIGAAQITLDKLASQLGAANLSGNIIGQTNLQANSVAQTNLQANSVVASNITAGVIGTNKFDSTVLVPSAWAMFDATSGSIVIRRKYNIDTITRHAAGVYSLAFSNAMSGTNYMVDLTVGAPARHASGSYGASYHTNTVNGFAIVSGIYSVDTDTFVTVKIYGY